MTDAGVLELAQRSVALALMICAPVLGFGLVVGLIVSVFQAATQIQEMTLTFVPKIIAVLLAAIIFGPWIIRIMLNFTSTLFMNLPNYMRM